MKIGDLVQEWLTEQIGIVVKIGAEIVGIFENLEINLVAKFLLRIGSHHGDAKRKRVGGHHLPHMGEIGEADFYRHIRLPSPLPVLRKPPVVVPRPWPHGTWR